MGPRGPDMLTPSSASFTTRYRLILLVPSLRSAWSAVAFSPGPGDLPVGDEIGEFVQDEPGIRDRPGIPGMTRKRKPTMEDPDVPPLRSPAQARTRLAEWPLIVDKPPDDQAAQVEIASRLATARAPIEDREPAPAR